MYAINSCPTRGLDGPAIRITSLTKSLVTMATAIIPTHGVPVEGSLERKSSHGAHSMTRP